MNERTLQLLKNADVSKHRAIPFWSWNDELEIDELVWQIKWMKEQGFGGYFMHARGGLTTEYLGEHWFDCVKACADAGEKYGLDSWAYDENGWPSGFVGGKLLEDPKNCDKSLSIKIGEFDKNALVSYLLDGEKLQRVTSGGTGEYLNIYETVSNSTADILNPEVVKKFINLTHEQYKEKLGEKFKSIKGFFTDEPQYFRWAHPFTDMIVKYFKEEYNQDIFDGLGLLFVEKEGYRDFRYKYWLGMQKLMLNSFSKQVYEWCDDNGVMLTGHYVEESTLCYQLVCCGGIMPFYEYEHIPGIDHLSGFVGGAIQPKQVSSVAKQLGKKRVLTETFGCAGWGVSANQTKRIAEWQYVNGVNVMCQHLLPYSEHGQRKRDYPAHYSWANPWIREEYKPFNDYFARLGYLIAESEEPVSVALFNPVRSLYFDFKRSNGEGAKYPIDESYRETADMLTKYNIPYHIIDETIMEKHAKIENGKLVVGNCSYDTVVFPMTFTMGKFTAKLMEEFYKVGGKMLFTDQMPTYLEGAKHTYNFKSNTDLESIINAQEYSISDKNTEIQSTYRIYNGKKFIYAVNLSNDKEYTVNFGGGIKGYTALDLEDFTTKKVSSEVRFEPGQSFVLFLSDEQTAIEEKKKEIVLDGEFKVVDATDNYLFMDRVEYSADGLNYSNKISCMGAFWDLLDKRHNGDLYLRYTFVVQTVPERISLLAEDLNNIWCEVNGNRVVFDGVSDFEKKIYRANIADFVKKGENQIIFKINFYQDEEVYDILFGKNGTEGLKNKLAYNTTIEACYLQGDFGVYAKQPFVKGQKKNVFLADEFYIGKRKDVVKNTLIDGYPFFAGNMTLEKEIESDGGDVVLNLKGEYCLSKVKVNGVDANKSYFAERVDVSNLIKKGKNKITVKLWSGNRNLLGPHHYLNDEDSKWVGPHAWELIGSWKDGVSSLERENYAFVRFGLFDGE